jgi:hypothetical protein
MEKPCYSKPLAALVVAMMFNFLLVTTCRAGNLSEEEEIKYLKNLSI